MRNLTDYIWDSTPFHRAVDYYLHKAAIAVTTEAYNGVGQPTTAQHLARVAYGDKILAGEHNVLQAAIAVATNGTIKTCIEESTDYSAHLEYAVNSMYDSLAGIDKGVAA